MVITFVLLLAVIVVYVVQSQVGLGGGYQYVSNRSDDLHIIKDGKVIVKPTMIDLVTTSDLIVGLRLPSKHLGCDGSTVFRIKIENKKQYFILIKDSRVLFEFNSQDKFEAKLSELNVLEETKLDYSKFDSIWQKYSDSYNRIDYSNCEYLN